MIGEDLGLQSLPPFWGSGAIVQIASVAGRMPDSAPSSPALRPSVSPLSYPSRRVANPIRQRL